MIDLSNIKLFLFRKLKLKLDILTKKYGFLCKNWLNVNRIKIIIEKLLLSIIQGSKYFN